MINAISSGRLQAFFLVLCLLTMSACSVGLIPPDAAVPGSRSLTADEYVERYAGNSIAFAAKLGDPIETEIYYGKDGLFYAVSLDYDQIRYGTWSVHSALGSSHINVFQTLTGIDDDGKPYRYGRIPVTLFTYVLPDGTASIFSRSPSGPEVLREPKPTPGFQARARFDALKRKIDAALGS